MNARSQLDHWRGSQIERSATTLHNNNSTRAKTQSPIERQQQRGGSRSRPLKFELARLLSCLFVYLVAVVGCIRHWLTMVSSLGQRTRARPRKAHSLSPFPCPCPCLCLLLILATCTQLDTASETESRLPIWRQEESEPADVRSAMGSSCAVVAALGDDWCRRRRRRKLTIVAPCFTLLAIAVARIYAPSTHFNYRS